MSANTFAFALLLVSSSAGADVPSRAESLFQEARELIAERRYDEACVKLAESEGLDPAIGTEFNLARCYELGGRTASAWKIYERVAKETHAAGQDAREAAARARMVELAPRIRRLVVRVTSDVAGLEVTLDGEVLPRDHWGADELVDPVPHVVRAEAPGRKGWQAAVDATQRYVVVPALDDAPSAATPPRGPTSAVVSSPAEGTPVAAPSERPGASARSAGIVVAGVGTATLVAGAVLGAFALSNQKLANRHCTFGPAADQCDGTGIRLESTASSLGDGATIALVVGGASVVTGGLLWLTAPRGPSHLRVVPGVAANGAALQLAGTW